MIMDFLGVECTWQMLYEKARFEMNLEKNKKELVKQ